MSGKRTNIKCINTILLNDCTFICSYLSVMKIRGFAEHFNCERTVFCKGTSTLGSAIVNEPITKGTSLMPIKSPCFYAHVRATPLYGISIRENKILKPRNLYFNLISPKKNLCMEICDLEKDVPTLEGLQLSESNSSEINVYS